MCDILCYLIIILNTTPEMMIMPSGQMMDFSTRRRMRIVIRRIDGSQTIREIPRTVKWLQNKKFEASDRDNEYCLAYRDSRVK